MPDEVYRRARIKAAEQETSVSAVVRTCLEEYACKQTNSERGRELVEILARIRRNNPNFSSADNLSRDDLHDRDALR